MVGWFFPIAKLTTPTLHFVTLVGLGFICGCATILRLKTPKLWLGYRRFIVLPPYYVCTVLIVISFSPLNGSSSMNNVKSIGIAVASLLGIVLIVGGIKGGQIAAMVEADSRRG